MNNNDNNLKYKEKYLKYKHKYVMLKNQSGGKLKFNSDLTKCEDDRTFPEYNPKNYSFYDAKKNKCCDSKKYNTCNQLVHTIDHIKIPLYSQYDKTKYEFDTRQKYTGLQEDIYTSPVGKKIEFYKEFTTKDGDKEIVYTYVEKPLGSGSFGVVFKYITKEDTKIKCIAVKYGNIEDDKKTISIIEKYNKSCSELLVKYIVHDKYIIMENAVGTIRDLRAVISININILIDILYAILIAIQCLYYIDLFYTDIKIENIFYRNTDDSIQIILGDLGSATEGYTIKPESTISASYYPYETSFGILDKLAIIKWGIGILILRLININEINLYIIDLIRDNLMKNVPNKLNDVSNNVFHIVMNIINLLIKNGYSNIVSLIRNTLCPSNERWTFDQIISEINIQRGIQKKEQEKKEQERKEQERKEQERKEQERLEKERLEKERLEKERLEKERLEKERLEKERLEKERLEKERLEKERLEKERQEGIAKKNQTTIRDDGSPIIYTGYDLIEDSNYKFFRRTHDNLEFKLLEVPIYDNIGALILKYENITDGKKTYIAVKYANGQNNLNKDLQIINIIRQNKNKCSELLVKYIVHTDIHNNNNKCIIMEYAIETIKELIPRITPQNKILIDILYAVAIDIKCLYDIGLYYTDIQAENILLCDNHNGGIQIILSQLDRITDKDTSIYATYGSKPYEAQTYDNPNNTNLAEFKKHVILWNFGLLICELLQISTSTFNYSSYFEQIQSSIIDRYKSSKTDKEYNKYFKDELDNIITKCKKKYYNIYPLIKNLLCVYTDRWNLEQIIIFLNKLRNNNLVDERRYRKEKNKAKKQVASEAKVRKTNEREVKERLEQERLEKERLEKERLEKERLEKERQEKERLEKERQEKERQEKERLEKERQEKERLEKERQEKERQEKERLEKERLEKEKLNYIITGTTNSVTTSNFSPTCKILITCDNLKTLKEEINEIKLKKNKKNKLNQDINIIIKGRFMNYKKFRITGKITHIYPKDKPIEHKFVIKYNSSIINKVNINKEFNFSSLCIYDNTTYKQNNKCIYNT